FSVNYFGFLRSNIFNHSSTSCEEIFRSLLGLGAELRACFSIPAKESEEVTSACAARAFAWTCLSEETTVQFLALFPSFFNRLRIASSAVVPSRTKWAVTAPSFRVPAWGI